MCGLVGLISPSCPININLLNTMRDRLYHRGPTSAGNWVHTNNRIAFGHRRLSIIDMEASANQPMSSHEGDLTLVFNGEIYNYIELREELISLGHSFKTNSDTEVLLLSYRQWGSDAIPRFNGMFAFLLWDHKSERMLVARDRFGEKPLFIGRGKLNTVVFASEIKAIVVHPNITCSKNEKAIEKFTSGSWYENDELTFFEDIERFPSSYAAWFSKDGIELSRWKYWIPDYDAINFDIKPFEAAERFNELMQRSIDLRLRADVPVGSSLSGGLDSSLIVGLLANKKKSSSFSQNTFSAVFPTDPTMSEDKEIKAVVHHTGVNSFLVSPNPYGLVEDLEELHWHQEEPFLSASIYLQWCVARLAKENNTTVLMDGQGADELLAGYQSYFRQRQNDLLEQGRSSYALTETIKFNRRLDFASKQFKDSSRRFNSSVAFSESELRQQPNFNKLALHPNNLGISTLRETLKQSLISNGLPMLLRYADRNSMAFSREVRLPFLDHNLVDYCISLPDDYYIRNGWQKWILRVGAGTSIPQSVKWRADKVGYAAPLDNWLRNELYEWAGDRIFSNSLKDISGYNEYEINKLWVEHCKSGVNNSWSLWKWISLSEWLNIFNNRVWKNKVNSLPMH